MSSDNGLCPLTSERDHRDRSGDGLQIEERGEGTNTRIGRREKRERNTQWLLRLVIYLLGGVSIKMS